MKRVFLTAIDYDRGNIKIELFRELASDGLSGEILGRAVYQGTRTLVEKTSAHQRRFFSGGEKAAESYVIAKIEKDLAEAMKQKTEHTTTVDNSDRYFSEIFGACTNLLELAAFRWNAESTKKETVAYLKNSLLPRMDLYGPQITTYEMCEIKKDLITKAGNSKRGKKNEATATRSVESYLDRCFRLYRDVASVYPEYRLPMIDFPESISVKSRQPEMSKSLPQSVRTKFCACLLKLAEYGNPYAFLAAAMFYFALRTSEAAALSYQDLLNGWHEKYCVCHIVRQAEGGKIVNILKTEAAYRTAMAPAEFGAFLALRKQQLNAAGLSCEGSEDLLFAGLDGKPVHSNRLSAFMRSLLEDCGAGDNLSNAEYLMQEEPDPLDAAASGIDITAYVSRRDGISRMASVCGISTAVIDQIVGHKKRRNETQLFDFNCPDIQQRFAIGFNRCVCLPECSANPAVKPVVLTPNLRIALKGNPCYQFVATEDVIVEFTFRTTEPADSLTICTNGNISSLRANSIMDNIDTYAVRPIFGAMPDLSHINAALADAAHIDLGIYENWR